MDTIPNGHNPKWTQSQMDTTPNGHNPEWTRSRMCRDAIEHWDIYSYLDVYIRIAS